MIAGPTNETNSTAVDRAGDLTPLVDRRAELLARRATGPLSSAETRELTALGRDLEEALATATDTVRRLFPGPDDELLARLAAAEPVHPLDDPTDRAEVTARAQGDRACFVLESPLLPGRPRNVVWVALCRELPAGMDELLCRDRELVAAEEVRVAVFYSIWAVEPGLAGIPGGSALLHDTMARLLRDHSGITTCTTLSPIPGFRTFLQTTQPDLATAFDTAFDPARRDPTGPAALDLQVLLRSCAHYLVASDERGRLLDDVARFHLRNGARLWRLVVDGDRSLRGQARSWGVMANYRYHPEDLARNQQELAAGRPALGDEVAPLLR